MDDANKWKEKVQMLKNLMMNTDRVPGSEWHPDLVSVVDKKIRER